MTTTPHTEASEAQIEPESSSLRRRPGAAPAPMDHQLNPATKLGLVALGLAVALVLLEATRANELWSGAEETTTRWLARNRSSTLTSAAKGLWNGTFNWLVPTLIWVPFAVLLVTRRIRSAVVFFIGFLLVVLVASVLSNFVLTPRPFDIAIEGRWQGFAFPDLKVATTAAALTSVALHSVPHGRIRHWCKILAAAVLTLLALSAVYLGVVTPLAALASSVIGYAIPLLLFRWFTPPEHFPVVLQRGNTAHLEMTPERIAAIQSGITDQLGIGIVSAKRIGLEGSAGSTPLLLTTKPAEGTPPKVFAKLYARSHLRSDALYKLGRTLLYGRLEDEGSYPSVLRLAQYEDYIATKMYLAGIATPQCLGVVELASESEYVVVFDFLDGAEELADTIHDGELSDQILADGAKIIDQLWTAGLAHRDIKPSNLMVTPEGRLAVIDVAFAEVRPTRWRQLVDLGNMTLLLAVGADPKRVLSHMGEYFTDGEIADGLAAAHGVARPSQLRESLNDSPRQVEAELRALLPKRDEIRIQRWSIARVVTGVAVVLSVLAALVLFAISAQLSGLLPGGAT